MKTKQSMFEAIEQFDGIYSATKGNLRCVAIRLKDGTLCLYSPVLGLHETAINNLKSLGEVSILFAPNHYHNKGLSEYKDAFPNADLVTTEGALDRLKKVTGFDFHLIDQLNEKLPENIRIIHTKGLKTGEAWIEIKQNNSNTWLVVDAFCGEKIQTNKSASTAPQLLGTFPTYGIKDKNIYLPWLLELIQKSQPLTIIPCHGSIIHSKSLPKQLIELTEHQLNQ